MSNQIRVTDPIRLQATQAGLAVGPRGVGIHEIVDNGDGTITFVLEDGKTFITERTIVVDVQVEAEEARDKAQEWAEKDVDSPVEGSQYSAKHHATKAGERADSILHNTKETEKAGVKATTKGGTKGTTVSGTQATTKAGTSATTKAAIKATEKAGTASTSKGAIKQTTKSQTAPTSKGAVKTAGISGVKATTKSSLLDAALEEYAASTMPFTPAGGLSSDNVQDAIVEAASRIAISETGESATEDTVIEIEVGGNTYRINVEKVT